MYAKIDIYSGANELENHLNMNGYHFTRIGNEFFILEDEVDYVKTIMDENNVTYTSEDIDGLIHFYNEEEAINYGERLRKYDWEKVRVGDDNVILCGTCLPYIDDFHAYASEILEKFEFDIESAELRDAFIEAFEEKTGYRFMDVYDTF